jgi:DegV family protein with EDD domain
MIAIVTDSTSDMPQGLPEKLGIVIVPAIISMEGKTYRDGVDIQREQFYQRQQTLQGTATTGAPSPLAFEEAYQAAFAAGADRVLSVHLASQLSGLFNVAVQASKRFDGKVEVYDSEQVSLGLGFQVLASAQAAQAGMDLPSILNVAEECKARVRSIIMIDTLQYLHKSGRVGWLGAGIGNLLSIRLLVEVSEGQIRRIGQERTRGKALQQLVDRAIDWGPLEKIGVGHSGIPEEAAEFATRLSDLTSDPAYIVDTTPALGVHVGPGAIGIFGLLRPE